MVALIPGALMVALIPGALMVVLIPGALMVVLIPAGAVPSVAEVSKAKAKLTGRSRSSDQREGDRRIGRGASW